MSLIIFFAKKIIKKLDNAVLDNDDIIFLNKFFLVISHFLVVKWVFLVWIFLNLNIVNFNDLNFDEDDPETIIHVRLTAWGNIFKQRKTIKKEITKE